MTRLIHIDGSMGEGGGQVLRSSLALSAITGQPVQLTNVRAGRRKPGLLRQHLTGLRAAAEVCGAEVSGDELGSRAVTFRPSAIRAGTYRFAVGSAGSAALVLQTILPILLHADEASEVTVEGGTHALAAPPFPFLDASFAPALRAFGPDVVLTLDRPGFYPAGGGRIRASIHPVPLRPIERLHRGELETSAHAIVSGLPMRIGVQELRILRARLGLDEDGPPQRVQRPVGPGNACWLVCRMGDQAAVFTGFGQKGVHAKDVARSALEAFRDWSAADVPVCEHLADQLLLPMAFAGGGVFRTTEPSRHTRTNAEVIHAFTGQTFRFDEEEGGAWRVSL